MNTHILFCMKIKKSSIIGLKCLEVHCRKVHLAKRRKIRSKFYVDHGETGLTRKTFISVFCPKVALQGTVNENSIQQTITGFFISSYARKLEQIN